MKAILYQDTICVLLRDEINRIFQLWRRHCVPVATLSKRSLLQFYGINCCHCPRVRTRRQVVAGTVSSSVFRLCSVQHGWESTLFLLGCCVFCCMSAWISILLLWHFYTNGSWEYTQWVKKICATLHSLLTSTNTGDFLSAFFVVFPMKFATKLVPRCPPHLRCVVPHYLAKFKIQPFLVTAFTNPG